MIKKTGLILTLILLCSFTFAQKQKFDLILYNGNIVDVEKGVIIKGRDIFIKDGIIKKIKKSSIKTARKSCVDVSGKYIMPGLIDSHVHWANFGFNDTAMKNNCAEALREGVTTARDVGGDIRIINKYKDGLKMGKINGPTIYYSSFWAGPNYFKLSGSLREETKGYRTQNAPWHREITGNSDSLDLAMKEAKEWGCMGVKIYNDYDADEVKRITSFCKKNNLKAWAHFSTSPASAKEVIEANVDVVSHIYLIDGDDQYKLDNFKDLIFTSKRIAARKLLFEEMIKRDVVLDATLIISMENNLKHVIEYMKEAYGAGVKFVIGTDYAFFKEDGKMTSVFLDEMNLYVDKCDIPIIDVLRAATINGADILDKKNKLGIIKKAAEADILVLNSNPIEALSAFKNRHMIIIDGEIIKLGE